MWYTYHKYHEEVWPKITATVCSFVFGRSSGGLTDPGGKTGLNSYNFYRRRFVRILGIDPGYATLGWGVIDYNANRFKVVECGAVITKSGLDFPKRLEQIYDGVCDIIAKHSPDMMSVEELFFNTNTTTAIGVAQARGVVLLSARKSGLSVFEYTPLQVKQSVVGYGRAEKKQVMEMTRLLLNLKEVPKPDDTADALAIALCHAHSFNSNLYEKAGL